MSNADGRKTVKIEGKVFGYVIRYKKLTRMPVGEFTDEALYEKLDRLPDDVKKQLGIKLKKK